MEWQKKGKLFESPIQLPSFPKGYVSHAQSPQVLSLENGFRCYFSTRMQASNGKFTSHVAYAEYTDNFEYVKTSEHQIISLGKLGCYDEHGIFPFHVLPVKDKVYGYISGWTRRTSVSVDTGVGLAISHDGGQTFERCGEGPILTASLHEPFLVGDPFVIQAKGCFEMWYIYGTEWLNPEGEGEAERVYKIGHAASDDGVTWQKSHQQVIPDSIGDECQALPSVAYYGGCYHMVFCFRNPFGFRKEKGKGYRLGYAFSTDLKTWTREDEALNLSFSAGEWDSNMQCYPHLCVLKEKLCLFYNGNDFGKNGFGMAVLKS